jgi:hypothetical protein
MRTRLGYLFGLLGLLAPQSARAFSDGQIFADPTTTGGGGGRFFTGSPVDGYTCAVCHQGGVVPVVTVRGLPDLYIPGQTYEIQVDWTQPEAAHALNLELVTNDGMAGGTLSLPDESSIGASGRCNGKSDAEVAAYLMKQGSRQIVGVSNCGAQTLRFRFRAPDADSVAFAGAVVRTDGSETAAGDGVLELKRVLHRDGGVLLNPNTQCSHSPRSRPSKLALFLWAALSVGFGRRGFSQRKSRLSKNVPS